MKTRIGIATAVLVLAVVFGFIFWNQFTSNQNQLAGNNNPTPAATQNQTSSTQDLQQTSVPKNDSLDSIEASLSSVDIIGIDSDSAELSSELNGF